MNIEFTKEQINVLKEFLARVELRGSEAQIFMGLINKIIEAENKDNKIK